ncbi:MipA/OmpV family protein [Phyllobacterium salinisoli]|uniref:MipA/OmpV family protein n=1 Tax=Phyllobacterium salinisoli TaxID=1899321 RepID=A0A368JWY6_9HYPH|nr:MipA/OmpV family protein [Phyllobacterium salinisoli]RCS21667.1 MipA/OmpV family protein [Phyllobacterium salinisoli]
MNFTCHAKPFAAYACLALSFGFISPTYAQSGSSDSNQADPGWIVTLGGGTEYGPSFEGARNRSFSFVPSLDFRRADEAASLGAPDDNIDYTLFQLGGLELGPVVGIRGNRKTSQDSRLEGLHEIRWSVDAGAFAQYWPIDDRLRLRIEARQDLRAEDGFVADLGADWFQRVGDKILLSAGARLSLANTAYMQNSFGVSEAESLRGAYFPAFDAHGGFKSTGFVISATYQMMPDMNIQLYNKFEQLIGDAADSPLVRLGGSANQNTVGVVFTRSFPTNF